MPSTRRLLDPRWLAGIACLLLAGALYFSEWVEVSSNGGYSAAALRNQYLAAEQFLQHFGIVVEPSDGLSLLDELPPTTDTMLIASSRRALSERRVERLMRWVDGGGRLLVFAVDYWEHGGSGDKLMDDLGLHLYKPREENAEPAISSVPVPQDVLERLVNQTACGTGGQLTRVSLAGEEQDLTASMTTSGYLEFQGQGKYSYAENAVGPQLMYIEVGEGAIVALTSLRLWTNPQIHCHDHAHLLRWLTDDRPVLWWLFNTDMEPLPSLIWERFPVPVTLLGCWVALWVWRSAKRIARIPAAPDPARRELTEHLDGVGRFYWQQHADGRLLEPLRRAVLRGRAPTAERIAALARRSDISEQRVRQALIGIPETGAKKDSGGFLAVARTLYDLSKLNG